MTKAKRAVIYCRISDDKAGQSLGVQRQKQDCETLAKSLGWAVAQVIIENDHSAYSGRHRPGYQQLLDGLRDGTYDGVLAWHSDRLHRRPIELEEYIHVCQAKGVRTHTVKGGEVDLATPEGMLRAGMLGQIARYESAHKSDRITRAHQQAAEAGKWRGGTRPFGYLADGTTPHPEEAPLVAEAYDAVLRGESLYSIARAWNDKGFRGTGGKEFGVITFRTILLRARNMGASVYKGKIVKRDAFTPIVSEDTFAAVHALLKTPGRQKSTAGTHGRWLLSGLAFCGICAAEGLTAKMGVGSTIPRNNPDITKPIYKCRLKHHMGRRADLCDEFITGLVLTYLGRPHAQSLLHHGQQEDGPLLHQQAVDLRTKLDEYATMLAADEMTKTQFREATAITRARLDTVERKLFTPGQPSDLKALIEAPDTKVAWEELSWKRRQTVVDALMVVTILPVPRSAGRRFDPKFIRVEWRPTA